jgi:ComF family protein
MGCGTPLPVRARQVARVGIRSTGSGVPQPMPPNPAELCPSCGIIPPVPFARVKSLLGEVADLIYPTACAACEAFVDGRGPLCHACSDALDALADEAACRVCAKPLAAHGDPCPWCDGKGEPNLERVVRLGVFADPVRHLVYRMKYHGRWPLAEFFADRLMGREPVKSLLTETDCLVPVPLHPLRQVARGYNQAEVLARRLAWHTGRFAKPRVVQPLVRVRNTETQTAVHSRAKREENLRHAFGLANPGTVRGKHVVLVDDVFTTGATLQSAARALKPAKPASISALAIASADPKRRDFEVM